MHDPDVEVPYGYSIAWNNTWCRYCDEDSIANKVSPISRCMIQTWKFPMAIVLHGTILGVDIVMKIQLLIRLVQYLDA